MSANLRSVRSVWAMLRRPRTCTAIGELLASGEVPAGDPELGNLVKLGFAREEAGRIRVSDEFLRDGQDALERYLSPEGVLQGELIDVPNLPARRVDDVVAAVARRIVRPGEAIAESALNERLRMFVLDVAFFRRHAVDTGVLRRSPDGTRYELTED